MYRIIDKKSTGKTSRLLLLAKENGGIVVCENPDVMRQKAYNYGIVGIEFISYETYLRTPQVTTDRFYIDELDKFLKHFNIDGYTISEE